MHSSMRLNPIRRFRRRTPNQPVSPAAIRALARQIVERFQPEKIILFGSYAYGTPTADSDVDLLVVMQARNELDQAARIRAAIDPAFPVDVIVRKPATLQWRLREGDWFLREIMGKGVALHEQDDLEVDQES